MAEPDLRNRLRAAIVDHLRWWLASDGVHKRRLCQDGKIDPETLRKIANDYNVSRGLRKGKEVEIAEMLQSRLEGWPVGERPGLLKERADFVYKIANDARAVGGSEPAKQLTNGLQLSAFSKLCWFLRPKGWTMYDIYARQGLVRPNRNMGFIPFYRRLDELRFVKVADKMRCAVHKSAFPYLWPERIIDKYLMHCGQPEARLEHLVSELEDYLEVQNKFFQKAFADSHKSFADNVEDLTDELLPLVKNEPLFAMHTQPEAGRE